MLKSHLRLPFYRSDIASAWIIAWLINIQVVAEQTGIKVERSSLLNVQQSWTFNFVADLLPVQQSRLCWIQLCCQCVTGFNHLWLCSVQKLSKSVNICKSCHKSLLPRFYGALYIVGQVKAMMKYGREVRDWEGGSENGGTFPLFALGGCIPVVSKNLTIWRKYR